MTEEKFEVGIPLVEREENTYSIRLGKKSFRIHYKWNPVSSNWYLSVLRGDGSLITQPIKIVPEIALVRTNSFEFEGKNFYCYSEKGVTELRRDNLGPGKDFEIWYGWDANIFLEGYTDLFPTYPESIVESLELMKISEIGRITGYGDYNYI